MIAVRPLLSHWTEHHRTSRITARVTCGACGWRAELTDDSAIEVMEALARRLRDHELERHPEPTVPS